LTSSFGVIVQMLLAFFPRSLQVISEPPSKVRPCGTRTLYDMALTSISGVQGEEFVTTPLSHIKKMRNSPHRVGGL